MFHRIVRLSQTNSFFLFGPRGTGKSTLLHELFKKETVHFIDLLDPVMEDLFHRNWGIYLSPVTATRGGTPARLPLAPFTMAR